MAEHKHGPGLPSLVPLLALILALGGAAWAQAHGLTRVSLTRPAVADLPKAAAPAPPAPMMRELVWTGADLDGDGQPDFANPTGKAVRGCDGFGCGGFGARRDGGERRHEGTDFDAAAGQAVQSPISGFVTKIGEAYVDDGRYRFVEIRNPALRYVARVFYVDPAVREGEAIRIGEAIGRAHSLEPRYPGITNHVHLELSRPGGRRLDAGRMIYARYMDLPAASGLARIDPPAPARG